MILPGIVLFTVTGVAAYVDIINNKLGNVATNEDIALLVTKEDILLLPTKGDIKAAVEEAIAEHLEKSTATPSPLDKAKALLEFYREELQWANGSIQKYEGYLAYDQSDKNKAKLAEYKLEAEELENDIRRQWGVVRELTAAE